MKNFNTLLVLALVVVVYFMVVTADCRSLKRDIALGWEPTKEEIGRLKICNKIGED